MPDNYHYAVSSDESMANCASYLARDQHYVRIKYLLSLDNMLANLLLKIAVSGKGAFDRSCILGDAIEREHQS